MPAERIRQHTSQVPATRRGRLRADRARQLADPAPRGRLAGCTGSRPPYGCPDAGAQQGPCRPARRLELRTPPRP
ncbi:hypothetical protein QOM21_07825 [Streptomyces sp. Pv4-95]|uniref:hypothetical protein n=1 Tax=Streptomyces sp. Pv4-95 TaxID=3049543 RepID=UPI003892AF31